MEGGVSEKAGSFFDKEYFQGTDKSKRGEFSLVEVGEKYEDRARFVIDRLTDEERKRKLKVLDVGGGAATFSRAIENLKGKGEAINMEVVTSDISRAGIDLVEGESGKKDFVQANVYKAPFPDSSFDGIEAWDILEHLDDPNSALSEVKRVLKPGGFIHVVCPNPEAYTAGTDKDTYRRDKSHVWPPMIGVDYFKTQFEEQGFDAEVFTRGFLNTPDFFRKEGKDLVKPAREDRSGTHIVVFARKRK